MFPWEVPLCTVLNRCLVTSVKEVHIFIIIRKVQYFNMDILLDLENK